MTDPVEFKVAFPCGCLWYARISIFLLLAEPDAIARLRHSARQVHQSQCPLLREVALWRAHSKLQ